jgi:hypothetical protein
MPYSDDAPLLNEVIEVDRVKYDDGKYSIKSAVGDFYNFRKTKADGTQSKAFRTFSELDVQEGSTVGVSFKINDYNGRVYRNIMLFKAYEGDEGPPRQKPRPATREVPRNGDAGVKAQDAQARQEARKLEDEEKVIGMCATNFLSASLSSGLAIEVAHSKVAEYVQLAERLLAACKAGSFARKRPTAPVPAKATREDLSGPWDAEDPPFDQDDNAF